MTQSWLWSRPLAPLVAALAAGIGAPSLGLVVSPPWLALAVGTLLFILGICCARGLPLTRPAFLMFFCLGLGLYQTALHPVLPPQHVSFLPRHQPLSLLGTVSARPIPVGSEYRLEVAASSWSAGGPWLPASGALWIYGLQTAALEPGDQVAMRVVLRPVADPPNPGAGKRTLALARRQIQVTGRLWQHLPPLKLASNISLSRPAAWQETVRGHCRRLLEAQPQPARAVFLALMLGDQSEISPTWREALNRTGTSHLMAISGLHLAMLAGAAFGAVFWLLRRSTWLLLRFNAMKWATVLAAGPVLAYAWVAQASPATQRAAIMILACLLLVVLDRRRDGYAVLALAAFVILAASPLMLYSLSFQLSFLSVWGLAYLSPALVDPWREWLDRREVRPHRLKKILLGVGSGLAVSLTATLATLPVIAATFHQAPTYGIIVNLVAVPLIGGLVLPLSFLAVLLSWLPEPVPAALLFVSRQVMELALNFIQGASRLPGVAIRLPAPALWQTVAYWAILLGLFKSPRHLWRWTGVGLALLVLVAPWVWVMLPGVRTDPLRVTVLDTPRQLAVVAALPTGGLMVINAGLPGQLEASARTGGALSDFLHTLRLRRMDYLAVLSVTPANAGPLLALAREFEVQEFWYGGERALIKSFWELRNLLGDGGREVKNLSLTPVAGEIGGVQVQTRQVAGANRGSGPIWMELSYGGRRLLILPPGPVAWRRHCLEAGFPGGEILILPAADLKDDFLSACLRQVKPRTVVVAGPCPETLPPKVGQFIDPDWYFTCRGAVTIEISPDKMRVTQFQP